MIESSGRDHPENTKRREKRARDPFDDLDDANSGEVTESQHFYKSIIQKMRIFFPWDRMTIRDGKGLMVSAVVYNFNKPKLKGERFRTYDGKDIALLC